VTKFVGIKKVISKDLMGKNIGENYASLKDVWKEPKYSIGVNE
jgi:hypothetical protein